MISSAEHPFVYPLAILYILWTPTYTCPLHITRDLIPHPHLHHSSLKGTHHLVWILTPSATLPSLTNIFLSAFGLLVLLVGPISVYTERSFSLCWSSDMTHKAMPMKKYPSLLALMLASHVSPASHRSHC